MMILAICGSPRRQSTNLALLEALREVAPDGIALHIFNGIGELPVFSPDLETAPLPDTICRFKELVASSGGLLIASPEYARGIPGGLKNAIDWLVSGDEVVGKPIALVHASHRGDDMLAAIRLVLSTVSSRFTPELFFRLPVMNKSPEVIRDLVVAPEQRSLAVDFLRAFAHYCAEEEVDTMETSRQVVTLQCPLPSPAKLPSSPNQ